MLRYSGLCCDWYFFKNNVVLPTNHITLTTTNHKTGQSITTCLNYTNEQLYFCLVRPWYLTWREIYRCKAK